MEEFNTPKEIAGAYRIAEIHVYQIQQLFGIEKRIDHRCNSTFSKIQFREIADRYPDMIKQLQYKMEEAHKSQCFFHLHDD